MKVFLVSKTCCYSEMQMVKENVVFSNAETALREFKKLKALEIHDLLDFHDLPTPTNLDEAIEKCDIESLEDIMEHIVLNADYETFFAYTNNDGTEEIEIQIEELEVK